MNYTTSVSAFSGQAQLEFKRDKQSEKEWFSDINEFWKSKQKSRRAEKLVIAGVAIEVIVAIVFAVHDVCEKYEINKQNAANNPFNLPLSDLTADVYIRLKGAPNDSPSPFPKTMAVMQFFSTNLSEGVSLSELSALCSYSNDSRSEIWEDSKSHALSKEFFLHFHKIDYAAVGLEYAISHPSPGVLIGRQVVRDIMEKVANIQVNAWCIPHDAEIDGGTVTLLANGSIPKYFVIPPQKAFPPPRGLGTNANNSGFTMFATNSLTPFATRIGVWPNK